MRGIRFVRLWMFVWALAAAGLVFAPAVEAGQGTARAEKKKKKKKKKKAGDPAKGEGEAEGAKGEGEGEGDSAKGAADDDEAESGTQGDAQGGPKGDAQGGKAGSQNGSEGGAKGGKGSQGGSEGDAKSGKGGSQGSSEGDAKGGKSGSDGGARGKGSEGDAKSGKGGSQGAAEGGAKSGAEGDAKSTLNAGAADDDDDSPSAADQERRRVEEAKKKLAVEGRKQSQITPGSASRWSNRGAMTPIVSEVPITAPLPARAIPKEAGVETPGQALIGEEELLQARFSFSAYHLSTADQLDYADQVMERVIADNRDIDVFRGRASLAYERIAGSDIGAHLDLEYRSRLKGSRPTDYRINELYVSYGLTDFRGRQSKETFGVAVGRVAVREAGYARADGAAIRLRLMSDLNLGVFGGFSGNPYGYNWALQKPEDFSTNWITAGGFAAYRTSRFFANVAGVATLARVGASTLPGAMMPRPEASGLDRFYLYLDVGYLVTEKVDIFVLGWVDLIGVQPIQSIQSVVAYKATNELDLRLGVGRFSTVVYDVSTAYAYSVDNLGNKGGIPNSVLVDETNGNIVPYDAVLQSAVYNSLSLRAGYRFSRELEAFVTGEGQLRDTSFTDEATLATTGGTVKFSKLRLMPGAGMRFRDVNLFDAAAQVTYIADEESQANMMIQGSIGRGWEGLYGSFDLRRYFGTIAGTDGGVDVSYVFPRDWFSGRLMLRAMARYYIENVALERPSDPAINTIADGTRPNVVIPSQNSWLAFAGIEWRL